MEFLKRIKDRAPEYDAKYATLIYNYTSQQGGKSGTSTREDGYSKGMYFSTVYEFYMYAALLGMKRNYRIPISYGTAKNKFIEMRAWRPNDIVDYIIMGLVGKSDIDLNEIEKIEEDAAERKITQLKGLLEDYTNGGLDLIQTKLNEDPDYFINSETSFLDFLEN